MSKKSSGGAGGFGFQYDCNCGAHFVSVGEAVNHVNKFKDHHLNRRSVE